MAVVQRARFYLRQSHILGHTLHRQCRRDNKEIRRPAYLSDRHEIAHRVPSQFGIEGGACGEEGRHQQPRVTVRRRARDLLGGDRAIGAGFGLDDDRAVPLRGHVLADDAGKHIRHASRRIGNDDAHRVTGKALLRISCIGRGNDREPCTHHHADAPYPHGVRPCPDRFSGAFRKRPIFRTGCRQSLESARLCTRPYGDALIATGLRAGIVIAATPITTPPRPIHAVGDRLSPRNITPSATPIGTRRYA